MTVQSTDDSGTQVPSLDGEDFFPYLTEAYELLELEPSLGEKMGTVEVEYAVRLLCAFAAPDLRSGGVWHLNDLWMEHVHPLLELIAPDDRKSVVGSPHALLEGWMGVRFVHTKVSGGCGLRSSRKLVPS